ncbi:hypothetical protein [Streptomyces sp. V1I1]|jgi:hypothetical protein|uniref:hypothetical protein n=1 Tax=Streptomyces sp. V1I1 TaxID=3042272 RepID=UPI002788D053|nr:hypothetical protein [Streptomyces sp. V1I1]MDQ0939576.1 hypothetical protein [Streptomyces sp. V1I1]
MMSGYAPSGTAAQEACTGSVEHDWRFAELVARSYIQPELALRYALEPRNVLAEFGIPTTPESSIPALPADADTEVTIINLSFSGEIDPAFAVPVTPQPCVCSTFAPEPDRQGAVGTLPM